MDIPASAAAPWVVLGAVLGLALAGLVALAVVLRRRGTGPDVAGTADGPGWADDDLPGFRETPPGVAGAAVRRASPTAWVSLAPAPPPAPVPPRNATAGVLVALGVVVLLVIGAAAAVAALGGRPAAAEPRTSEAAADGVTATLAFEGLVLERRAVGVTVTYPRLTVTATGDGRARAQVTLPAWNCLADQAPDDPDGAGCTETLTEYAELATPALEVVRDGDGLRFSGRFPTVTRPNGSPPEPTGRVYELRGTVSPDGGELRLGDDTAAATDVRGR